MKDRIRRSLPYAFFDKAGIAAYLERMASKGWMLEKAGGTLWTYRRTEPRTLHFAVTYFPDASRFDPGPTEGQLVLEDLCAADGWTLAGRWDQMQIFCSDRQDPPPLDTDPVMETDTVRRSLKKSVLPGLFMEAGLFLYLVVFHLLQFRHDPVGYLSDPIYLYLFFSFLPLAVYTLFELTASFRWLRKARRVEEGDDFPQLRTSRLFSRLLWVLSGLSVVMMVLSFAGRWAALVMGFLLAPLCVWGVRALTACLRRRGWSRKKNLAASLLAAVFGTAAVLCLITFLVLSAGLFDAPNAVGTYDFYGRTRKVYADDIPLRQQDFLRLPETVRWSTEARKDQTPLLSRTEYRQWPLSEDPDLDPLEYTVTEVKVPALYDFCKEALVNSRQDEDHGGVIFVDHYEPSDPAPWGALEAYQLRWSDSGLMDDYLLIYADHMVELSLYSPVAPDQMARIGEKLR